MCRIARLFLLQRLIGSIQGTRAISTTSRRELSLSFFFMNGKAPKKIHAILTETLEEHAPSYATVKKLGGLQKLEQRAKKFIELRGENVE